MYMSGTGSRAREVVFAPRLQALLRDHRGEEVFRLDPGTVGVAGAELTDRILAARPATEDERPTFKPCTGAPSRAPRRPPSCRPSAGTSGRR